ncbi:HAMP domain-containing sensor histidine kinase [Neisseria leonii]|uniref:histidine kinase n=1 Tax=Neisseria leonii TaxID=2995413 RepID=A0A9X4E2C8_9NEIS|nr:MULTISPECIES: HAMP domain-containing sensor histidine kinase [unclassified Neisseria]MDD9326633.1 HAMP domain-containing histidine kinase [Neisseria sp. 3986]MDD9328341.1 HAMP domain-containing histidine kinase [Neisseria sp. 51.81]
MKLFQRIFATFCAVIICAIFVASFSFRLVQDKIAENRFEQQRALETTLLRNAVAAFNSRGELGVRELLQQWQERPESNNVLVIAGDDRQDIFERPVDPARIELAYALAVKEPSSQYAHLEFDRFGQEYLFFIRNWDKKDLVPQSSPLFIPGLPVPRVWQEILILGFIVVVGLLLAYILANNIAKPIRILGRGMNRLAAGELDTRIAQHMDDRDDELSQLAGQFDKMAQQLQNLVAKERHLLHHVSHEMRSPLARMQAILGLIQAQPQKQEQYLQRLENELVRMDTLVGELLTLSRLETANVQLEKENLKLVPFLQNLVEDCQTVAQRNGQTLSLTLDKVPEDMTVQANESYLYRAFDNVIRNAMNYSPQGSEIGVVLRQTAKNWQIDITDNGPGVDEQQLPHIFTAFYRADSSANKPGTGLGLALAKHIIDQHQGKIIAENVSPNGLKMTFCLPKKAVKPAA